MKQQQVVDTGPAWRSVANTRIKIGPGKLVLEYAVTIDAKRMRIAKPVPGEFITPIDENRLHHTYSYNRVFSRRSIPEIGQIMSYDFKIDVRDGLVCVNVSGDRGTGDHVANADEVGEEIVRVCRETGINRILLLSKLTGRASPLEQFRTVVHSIQYGWSRDYRLAFVDLDKGSDTELRFVETVALNRVFKVQAFGNEVAARQWLDSFD